MPNPMIIWMIRDLEPLPTDPGDRRLMRAGMLAQTLARMGHSTRWITSSFDHYQKQQRLPRRQNLSPEPNLSINVLPGRGYSRNIGVGRIVHNRTFARDFTRFAEASDEQPDLIITDIPTTEAAAHAVAYAKRRSIPSFVSIRDLWPDFFAEHFPPLLRPLLNVALLPLRQQVRFACRNATALIGISDAYLEWGLRKANRRRELRDAVFPLAYFPRRHLEAEGIDAELAKLGVRPNSPIVAFVGSWGRTYDLELLLATIRAFPTSRRVQFVIAGTGESHSRLAPQFRALPNVHVPGWLSADQIAALLSRAVIGLLPYTPNAPQGLPNKAFEYLAYGAFQIATLGGELEQFYRETGAGRALVAPSPSVLADAISAALADPRVAQERDRRMAIFEARYSGERVYRDFAHHILAVAANYSRA